MAVGNPQLATWEWHRRRAGFVKPEDHEDDELVPEPRKKKILCTVHEPGTDRYLENAWLVKKVDSE